MNYIRKIFILLALIIPATLLSQEVLDRIEVIVPEDIEVEEIETLSYRPKVSEIFFNRYSSKITESQQRKLDLLSRNEGERIFLWAYVASDEWRRGRGLSRQRALSVKRYLARRFPGAKWSIRYYSSRRRVFSNRTRKGRDGNRLVIVKIR